MALPKKKIKLDSDIENAPLEDLGHEKRKNAIEESASVMLGSAE